MLAAAGPVAGCTTTMQTAARLQLSAARVRASQVAVRVSSTDASRTVRVVSTQIIPAPGRAAFVLTVSNAAREAQADLPLSVGWFLRGRFVDANAGTDGSYWDAHLPAISGRRTVRWVVVGLRPPAGARVIAIIGARPDPVAAPGVLPLITATTRATGPHTVTVALRTTSSIPQYAVPVDVIVQTAGRTQAAGVGSVGALGAGGAATVRVPLVGQSGGRVLVSAFATIFR